MYACLFFAVYSAFVLLDENVNISRFERYNLKPSTILIGGKYLNLE